MTRKRKGEVVVERNVNASTVLRDIVECSSLWLAPSPFGSVFGHGERVAVGTLSLSPAWRAPPPSLHPLRRRRSRAAPPSSTLDDGCFEHTPRALFN